MEEDRLRHVCFVGVEPPPRNLRQQRAPLDSEGKCWWRREADPEGKGGPVPGRIDPSGAFLSWLLEKAGLTFAAYRPAALLRRVPACLRALRASSVDEARVLLEERPEAISSAVEAVLIGVSQFFRDPDVFEELHRSVLPESLLGGRGLRVYSAGCSDGQELYSMAMLLAELGGVEGSDFFGEDCRPEAIARAAAGWFQTTELENMAREVVERYFQIHGGRARISSLLRGRTCWRQGDLLASKPAILRWDVILFRNVAIYLRPEQRGIWERLTEQLAVGGVLVTGKAERPPTGLPLKRIYSCIYKRV